MNRNLSGKVVVITGASRGIGAAALQAFAAQGAHVVAMARDAARITALARDIGPDAMALPCDMADWGAVDAAIGAVLARFGRIDVMINNAGVIDPISHLAEADPAAWGHSIDINLKGVFHGMKAVIPPMRAKGGGTIINVSSGAATNPLEGWSAYCAGKAGALMLTRAGHLEEGAHGLRILGLSPGTVATDMQVRIKASGINPVSQLDPSVHIPADWPARTLVWMCGPDADPWLGQDISLRDVTVRKAVGLIA